MIRSQIHAQLVKVCDIKKGGEGRGGRREAFLTFSGVGKGGALQYRQACQCAEVWSTNDVLRLICASTILQGYLEMDLAVHMYQGVSIMSEHFGTTARIAQTPLPFNYVQFIKLLVVCPVAFGAFYCQPSTCDVTLHRC